MASIGGIRDIRHIFLPESKITEAKGMAGKEVVIACKMGPAQYSRIENNKTDPALSSLVKIAKALGSVHC